MNKSLKLAGLMVFIAITSAVALAQTPGPTTIGVLNIAGPRRTVARNIIALLEADLSADSRFAVVERSELNKVLDEQALGKSGNITPETAARIGQLTGAKILVTGRELNAGKPDNIVVVASIIGTETGRVFSKTAQGAATNLVALVADLSEKITETVVTQGTNLIAATFSSPEQRLDKVILEIKDKTKPSIMLAINKTTSDANPQIAQAEMGRIFQKAGFTVVDDKSDQSPDILITGDTVTSVKMRQGNLFSGHATLQIKAQERIGGKILALDLQQGIAVDITKQTATEMALKDAADRLSERLLPTLVK